MKLENLQRANELANEVLNMQKLLNDLHLTTVRVNIQTAGGYHILNTTDNDIVKDLSAEFIHNCIVALVAEKAKLIAEIETL